MPKSQTFGDDTPDWHWYARDMAKDKSGIDWEAAARAYDIVETEGLEAERREYYADAQKLIQRVLVEGHPGKSIAEVLSDP